MSEREKLVEVMLTAMSEHHSGNFAEAALIVEAQLAALEAAAVRLVPVEVEVEAINTNDLRDYADRISNPYAQFILDAASQLDYARTDRNILQAELDAERARRAEVEGRHSTGWGSIYWWINAADKHAEYISERGYLIDGDHWQMISSLARATHKDTQDEH